MPSTPDFPLYRLHERDLPRAREVFLQAFWNDPFFTYVMGGEDYDRTGAGFMHSFTLRYGLSYGKVYASSDNLEGVAIWLPPGATHMTAWRSVRSGVLSVGRGLRGQPARVDAGRSGFLGRRRAFYRRLIGYGDFSAGVHERVAPYPHWYLLAIGVADSFRGKGYAGRLLTPIFAYLDQVRIPCYLETHNPANPALYEHFGFKVEYEGRLPGSDGTHWAMVRPAP